MSNPITQILHLLNYRAPSLTANTALTTVVGGPFISNVHATTPIAAAVAGGGFDITVDFIARDATGNIETNPVVISYACSAAGPDALANVTVGTPIYQNVAGMGEILAVTPDATTGRVTATLNFGAAGRVVGISIQNHIVAGGQVTTVV
jgi:tripartite-type tricarboxylate transporter receptor subunit TctC